MPEEYEYTADSIEILELRDAVRRRPGMYVGDTSTGDGALHLVLEVLGNAVDQVLLGRCARVDVRVDADDSVTIADDGPGIPADRLVDLLERPSHRPTVDGHRPHVHLSAIGLGLPVANALSEFFEVETVHAGTHASVRHAAGRLHTPLQVRPTTAASGTTVRFRPDPQIFSWTRAPCFSLTSRLEDLTFLVPAMTLSWTITGERTGGMASCVRAHLGARPGDVAHHQGDYPTADGPVTAEVALAWRDWTAAPEIHSFANLLRTDDGPHVDGLLAGVREFLPKRADKRRFAGLVAAVAVLLPDAQYGSPTKKSLANRSALPAVKAATLAALAAWATRNPEAAASLRGARRSRA